MFSDRFFKNKFFNALKFHIKLYAPVYLILSLPSIISVVLYAINFFLASVVDNVLMSRIPNALDLLFYGNLYDWLTVTFFFNLILSWVFNSIVLLLIKKKNKFQKIVIIFGFIFFMHICIYLIIFLYFFSLFIFNCKIYLIFAWMISSFIWLALFLNPIHITYNQVYHKKKNIRMQIYTAVLISCLIFLLICIFSSSSNIIIFFKVLIIYATKILVSFYNYIKFHYFFFIWLLLLVILLVIRCGIPRKTIEQLVDITLVDYIIYCIIFVLIIIFIYFF